jgi:protein TonB
MLQTLLESNAQRQRRPASTLVSIALHTALIGGAVVATASARSRPPRELNPPDGRLVYTRTPPPTSEPEPLSPADQLRRSGQPGGPWVLPGPRWTLKYAPDSLVGPQVDIDPGRMLAGDTLVPCIAPCRDRLGDDLTGSRGGDGPATVATVDRTAAMLAQPRPRYPDQLRAAGVTGRVLIRLVVDTMGRVEPASVVIRESSHDLFAQAVRAVMPSLRFRPAETAGRKVRMLVDLPFEFRLDH